MRSDNEIRHDVEEELEWDPELRTRDVAVSVHNGVVTLAGFVRSVREKIGAETDAKRVTDVVGLANDIEVRLPLVGRKPDPEIAREVIAAIRIEIPSGAQGVRARVADGRVTIEGEVEWYFQRARAEEVAARVKGIRSIRNELAVRPQLSAEIKRRIEEAIGRRAALDAEAITADTTEDGTVILKGSVHSSARRDEVEEAAWTVPGVRDVVNEIAVLA